MTRPRAWKPPPCKSGKTAYRTQGRALSVIASIKRQNQQAAAPISEPQGTYHCDCGAWHLMRQAGVRR